ncbi:MAG TPA: type II toxin-antitoxin system HipA family toxin [Eoetvoesiella sp.]|uniref:type II toxin-antitoxin system HipA family toxin n=1 Tax=Eoetvoesiella sp. TaxID=1966355 RepID=UPI002B6D40E1|nr:type II toxin-antitoxin system HipA family toxin [Eoetvoesiella sp.]HWK63255.1 type II toxin-antitoxin system HipA family toxin [Eoetvoesiella sp.]
MGRRSRTRALGLWMNGAFVGTWSIQPHMGEALQYDHGWVASEQGRPLSLSLPFTPGNQPHRGEAVRAYFENLLPDSKAIRERVARRFRTGSTDAFTLLAEVGRDCAGALQILPDGVAPAGVTSVQATPMSDAEVAQRLRGVAMPAQMGGPELDDEGFRISIAGAQEKTALLWFNGQWGRPHGATPTSHIFKLPLGLVANMKFDLSESVENEWLCSEILAAYGLPVARTELLRFEDMKVLAVERFDRMWSNNENETPWLVRLPQEDMCQATGTPPHLKYEADGGPGVERIMSLLETSRQSERDRRVFFQSQVLFWMLCATDGHAKNFSLFLRPGGSYELAPLYDVLSAYPILGEGPGKLSPFRAKMAMAVRSKNSHWIMRDIQRRHWLALGERYGVVTTDGRGARFVVDGLVARTPDVVRMVRAKLPPGFPEGLADSILGGLQAAADRLAGLA